MCEYCGCQAIRSIDELTREQTRKAVTATSGRAAETVDGGHDQSLLRTARSCSPSSSTARPQVVDITGRGDLDALLAAFYGRALADPDLRPVFVDVMRLDLDEHLPVIAAFWEHVLFRTGTYSGRTMDVHRRVHQRIPLTESHFCRWLELWQSSVDEMFAGPVAEQAKAHAARMASVFLRNLSAGPAPRSLPLVPAAANQSQRSHQVR